jgi:hypothetical protein
MLIAIQLDLTSPIALSSLYREERRYCFGAYECRAISSSPIRRGLSRRDPFGIGEICCGLFPSETDALRLALKNR